MVTEQAVPEADAVVRSPKMKPPDGHSVLVDSYLERPDTFKALLESNLQLDRRSVGASLNEKINERTPSSCWKRRIKGVSNTLLGILLIKINDSSCRLSGTLVLQSFSPPNSRLSGGIQPHLMGWNLDVSPLSLGFVIFPLNVFRLINKHQNDRQLKYIHLVVVMYLLSSLNNCFLLLLLPTELSPLWLPQTYWCYCLAIDDAKTCPTVFGWWGEFIHINLAPMGKESK